MAIILLIAIVALVIVTAAAVLAQVARDGYRAVPARRELLRRP